MVARIDTRLGVVIATVFWVVAMVFKIARVLLNCCYDIQGC